jgi:threonine dehydrogenase-like Zn-dependent dehydrogenase
MRGTVMYSAGDVRIENVPDPAIQEPTDAVIRVTRACICGSDLWPYRGAQPVKQPTPMGHEYVGVVEEVGSAVRNVKKGQFVVGSFATSDNTCPHCHHGYQSSCVNREFMTGAQAPLLRVSNADGTLVATPERPSASMIPSLLAVSDVLGTGWFAADAANVKPGSTVAVVGDGAVGLCGVLAAKRLGAERVVLFSRHPDRQALGREFGADTVLEERGDAGVDAVHALFDGVGPDCVLECVGTKESMDQALRSVRPGGHVGYVGVPSGGAELPIRTMFGGNINVGGGVAPARAYIPELLPDVLSGAINPGKVFDLTLPLAEVADGYTAMDERRAIKVLLQP